MSTQDLSGQQLEIAVLSPPIGGLVRTWTDEGPRLWRVDRPDELGRLLGRGLVARTAVEGDRYREVGFVGPGGALLVHGRLSHGQEQGPAQVFQLEPATVPAVDDEAWEGLAAWFGEAVQAAAARGEFLVLERGGWEPARTPFGFWGCFERDGVWSSVVEAEPWPGPLGPWAVASRAEQTATLAAPVSAGALPAAALLAVVSVSGWATSPWDLALTFGRSPSGPVPSELLAPVQDGGSPVYEEVAASGAVDAVLRFVSQLEGQRSLAATTAAQYVSLRPAAGGRVAVYVHPGRVSLALDPARARALQGLLAVKVEPKSATTWYVSVAEEVLAGAVAQVLPFAVEAVDRAGQG